MPTRPGPGDCHPYYFTYIDRVPADADVLELMARQRSDLPEWLLRHADRADYRYADDKWTVKEVVGHVMDTERAFFQRAFCAARREPAELPDFDQDRYAAHARYGARSLESVLSEYDSVRAASLGFFADLTDDEWARAVRASGRSFTARSVPFIMAGHQVHHEALLAERYLSG